MKNLIMSIIGAAVVIIVSILLLGAESYIGSHYTKDALIIYTEGSTVACVTLDGNEWEFEGKGFNVEDEIRVTFYTNMTDNNIYDDEIEKVKKIEKRS